MMFVSVATREAIQVANIYLVCVDHDEKGHTLTNLVSAVEESLDSAQRNNKWQIQSIL